MIQKLQITLNSLGYYHWRIQLGLEFRK